MSEALVERLNAAEIALRDDRPYAAVAIGEAADRIENIERENAECRRRNEEMDREITGLRNSYWEERKARLAAEEALRTLLDCPDIADNDDKDEETHAAERVARAALSGSGSGWRAMAKPLDAWHEDDGFVTWWTWRDGQWLGEPSYIGSPLCSDWPGYHTHWTKHPDFPAALRELMKEVG